MFLLAVLVLLFGTAAANLNQQDIESARRSCQRECPHTTRASAVASRTCLKTCWLKFFESKKRNGGGARVMPSHHARKAQQTARVKAAAAKKVASKTKAKTTKKTKAKKAEPKKAPKVKSAFKVINSKRNMPPFRNSKRSAAATLSIAGSTLLLVTLAIAFF